MGPAAALLPCGTRLHLQHGPIDLIIGTDGDRAAAFLAARACFFDVLDGLVSELDALRQPLTARLARPQGPVAQRMDRAVRPYAGGPFVTRMAAVAGSVADEVLAAMRSATPLSRAYVNNGGDIAVHLAPGHSFVTGMAGYDGQSLGQLTIDHVQSIKGIATSGRHGRSFSLGIADSVTVLAASAAAADVAATLIANAVDLPGHPAITRRAARDIDDTSDLGDLPVVTHCATLTASDRVRALGAGRQMADDLIQRGLIAGAALFLQGAAVATQSAPFTLSQRMPEHA